MMKPSDIDKIIEDTLSLSDRLFRVLLPTTPQELLELDVTMPQLKILLMLYINNTPMRMSSIAADLGVTLATATGLVDRLVERGMVIRDSLPEDRRVVLCLLSPEGSRAVTRIWQTARQRLAEILRTAQRETLLALQNALAVLLESAASNYKSLAEGQT